MEEILSEKDEENPPETRVILSADGKKISYRCRAMVKHPGSSRTRCQQYSFYDPEFCLMHGGASKHYLKRANDSLMGLAPAAVEVLRQTLVQEGDPCGLCGRGYISAKKLKAATIVFDRVGLGPTLKIEHSGTITHDVLVNKMTDDEFQVVDGIMQRVMSRVSEELAEEERNLANVS